MLPTSFALAIIDHLPDYFVLIDELLNELRELIFPRNIGLQRPPRNATKEEKEKFVADRLKEEVEKKEKEMEKVLDVLRSHTQISDTLLSSQQCGSVSKTILQLSYSLPILISLMKRYEMGPLGVQDVVTVK